MKIASLRLVKRGCWGIELLWNLEIPRLSLGKPGLGPGCDRGRQCLSDPRVSGAGTATASAREKLVAHNTWLQYAGAHTP